MSSTVTSGRIEAIAYSLTSTQNYLVALAPGERGWGLDIANLTPVQALVVLNEFQRRLREARR